ncbi:pPIWI_RE module domain-containing protein [Virgisporangium aurantiacum]|uniref:DUF3893 domain-containing protein n=1 Tax=Virgisporangium aurantiacum TaxID=175570 RepID=A0A8J4E707_9ACTN|nr:DUF3962 domain-containing protein [Virgisporangium aurantiacum]GIJ63673.1 hypothetical protein Vau01_111890 [Virgisporangium aurantiacum]
MSFDQISTAAFAAAPRSDRLVETFNALAFPAHWRQIILDFYRHGKKNPEQRRQVPIRGINDVIRAYAPDLVSVAKYASVDDSLPWLYTRGEYRSSIIKSLVLGWLNDLQPKPDDFPLVRATQHQLDVDNLEWDLVSVDLLEQELTIGGTAQPARHLYHLLPDLLADRIADPTRTPYTYNGETLHFKRVAREEGAELMSWPPLQRQVPSKTGVRIWSYSAYIRLTLHTVPFSSTPRIHLNTGIRRWVRGPVWMPADRGVTTYLLADSPWMWDDPAAPGTASSRFAAATLKWNKRERKVIWKASGAEGMLRRLTVNSDFPEPDILQKRPEEWLDRETGVRAAVVYHPMMGKHGIGAGLMPSERRRLTEWAAAALEPDFTRLPNLFGSDLKGTPKPQLKKRRPIPKPDNDKTGEKTAKALAANETIAAANSLALRTLTAEAVDAHLRCHLLYQTDECRDEIIRAAEESLGLGEYNTEAGTATFTWNTDELKVTIYARSVGKLAGPLGGADTPRKRKQIEEAVTVRRREVRERLESEPASQVVIVELDGRKDWDPRQTDPKFAIRLGCADAHRVSQFITTFRTVEQTPPEDGEELADEPAASGPHRADAAWGDALRQVGVRFVPQHSLGTALPDSFNQLAFWMVKRRSDSDWWKPQFTPIAVLIRPGQPAILGRTADSDSWVPYPQLLRSLTGRIRGDDLKTEAQQQAEAARFIHRVLYGLRNEPTVAITHANNSRTYVPWLENGITRQDMFQLGGGPVQRLALQGKHLRLIRLRVDDRSETPQWWAPKDPATAGIAKGLWLTGSGETDRRVFYSTMERSSTHQIENDATKLTSRIKQVKVKDKDSGEERLEAKRRIDNHKNAWNPQLLEIAILGQAAGDNAEAWAMFVHQQRQTDDYRDGLVLPMIMHLAELAGEYALPHEDPMHASVDDSPPTEASLAESEIGIEEDPED